MALPSTKKAPCMFVKSPKGCSKGDSCEFLHVCKFFSLPGGCQKGEDCLLLHGDAAAAEKSAVCRFFNSRGGCTRDDCTFLHTFDSVRKVALHAWVAEDPHSIGGGTLREDEILAEPTLKKVEKSREERMEAAIKQIAGLHRASLCFVIDTTGSMASHMDNVKTQIDTIVKQVQQGGCKVEHVALVGYKDWCDGANRLQVFPFNPDVKAFATFLGGIRATGGGDAPEDVIGGLAEAVQMPWPERSGTRVLFHLGDAPPHGKQYYDGGDDFPDGHKEDMPLPELFTLMRSKKINYFFGDLNTSCDKMKAIFSRPEHYGRPVDQFAVQAADAATLTRSVVSSVRDTTTLGMSQLSLSPAKLSEHQYTLDTRVPTKAELDALPEIPATLIDMDMRFDLALLATDRTLTMKCKTTSLRVSPRPFARGAVRFAFYGRKIFRSGGAHAESTEEDFVLKEFATKATNVNTDLSRYLLELETQTVAAKIAVNFTDALRAKGHTGLKLKFLKSVVVQISQPGSNSKRIMALERRFFGDVAFVRYTNNYNTVIDKPPGGQDPASWADKLAFVTAFSHFSHETSGGNLLVCDLQGVLVAAAAQPKPVGDGEDDDETAADVVLLTDPAIHSRYANRFSSTTNLKEEGMKGFFSTHVCNKYCAALELAMPAL